ncbi:MAG: exopolysaccharide biosynthesis protein [Silvanigrellaceae bacterium]
MNLTLQRIRAIRAAVTKESDTAREHHTVGELFVLLEPMEFAFSGVLFCVPFLQPVPLPGLSTPLGLAMAFFGVLTIAGKGHKALPHRVRMREIKVETFQKILGYAETMLERLARIPHLNLGIVGRVLSHPRALASHVVFLSLLLALPLPIPFSNSVPAWGVLFSCLAMIEANGIFILLAYLSLIGNLAFFAGLVGLAIQSVS